MNAHFPFRPATKHKREETMKSPLRNSPASIATPAQSDGAQEGKRKIESLLGTELNPLWTDENGWTQLHWAAAANDGEAARRLLELGAAPDITDNGDGSDFNEQGMRRLKLLGKKVDGWKNACATPLLVAAVFNSAAAASVLIANDAEVDAKDEDGWTPLHWAAHNNAPEIAKMLIEHGAEVNAKDEGGETPLHWAAEKQLGGGGKIAD